MDDDGTSAGAALAGRYELGGVLGRGGMGTVRDATDLRLGRAVAVKILRPELADQPRARRRFETEARAAARLVHPNVVTVFDSGEDGAVPFLVMERLPGATLAEEIGSGRLSVDRVRDVAHEILSALEAAHRAGIVHRDIKPGNVLLTDDGHVKVSDFGIAKAVDDVDQTQTVELVATLAYLAPERLAGAAASERSDLYAVGVLLYEALSGRRPFAEATPILEMRAIERGAPEPLASVRPEVSPQLAAVVDRAMARDPVDRYESAAAMSAALASEPRLEPTRPVDATVPLDPAAEAETVAVADTVAVARTDGPEPLATRPLPERAVESASAVRGGSARRLRLVVVAGVVAVIAATALLVSRRDDGAPSTPGATTGAPTTTLPAALEDALGRLEQGIAK